MKDVPVTAVLSAQRPKPPTYPLAQVAVVCWLASSALVVVAGVSASAQTSDDPAISFEWTVSPQELGPSSGFTIDPESEALEDGAGTIGWTLTVGPISDVAIDNTDCGTTGGTSCEADIDGDDATVTFSGVIEDDPPGEVTGAIEITGTIDDWLDRDTILFEAETCGTVEVVAGTPAPGRLPVGAATPDAACEGVTGTIEVTVVPATGVPTEAPTEAPAATPTIEPTATAEPTEAPTTTPEPTDVPTDASTTTPTATPEPAATIEPTDVPTEEPTATPTEAPTATPEPTVEPTATVMPSATAEPTDVPTEALTTPEPTDVPTDAPTNVSTEEPAPTIEPTLEPAAPVTESPPPTPAADDDGNDTGLWIGGGTLLVLAAAAGTVLYQRRKIAA